MTMEVWVRSGLMAILPIPLLMEIPHNKVIPDRLLAILLLSKKQMPNSMRVNAAHIHCTSQKDNHNSLTALISMVTSLTATILTINSHAESIANYTDKSSQWTIYRHWLPFNCYTLMQPLGRMLSEVPSFYR